MSLLRSSFSITNQYLQHHLFCQAWNWEISSSRRDSNPLLSVMDDEQCPLCSVPTSFKCLQMKEEIRLIFILEHLTSSVLRNHLSKHLKHSNELLDSSIKYSYWTLWLFPKTPFVLSNCDAIILINELPIFFSYWSFWWCWTLLARYNDTS